MWLRSTFAPTGEHPNLTIKTSWRRSRPYRLSSLFQTDYSAESVLLAAGQFAHCVTPAIPFPFVHQPSRSVQGNTGPHTCERPISTRSGPQELRSRWLTEIHFYWHPPC